MNDLELHMWTLFVDIGKNFLSNRRAENYKELVKKLLKSQLDIAANMSIKGFFFLHGYIDEFLDNCSNVNDEQGE